MARHTGTDDVRVIDRVDRRPDCTVMAVLANVACIDVHWVFARRNCAFMARRTRSKYLRVIDKIGRYPDDTIVAALAYVGRIDVRDVFACYLRIVVTANAVIGDASVIECRRNPRIRRMTIVTGITARKMRRVFTGCRCTVVAGEAGTDDLRVIDGVRRCKGDGVMAIDAHISGIDMCQVLAGGIGAIVAADAIIRDVGVIKIGRTPRRSRMAIVTGVAAGKMRRVLAGCDHAIVAGEAGADNLRVVYVIHRRPGHVVVAVFAHIAGRYMRRAFAFSTNAIMATETVVCDIGMVKCRGRPSNCRVAIFANIAGLEVRQAFPSGLDTIVAIGAAAGDIRVVEYRRYPQSTCVAVIALVAGNDVARRLARGADTVVTGIAAP